VNKFGNTEATMGEEGSYSKENISVKLLETHEFEFDKILGMATIGEAPRLVVRRRWRPPPGPD